MTSFLKTLPLLSALIAAPAWAAQPDPHAGHHPATAAETAKPAPETDAKPGMRACPVMEGKMASATGGKAPDGKMMMHGKDMHCRAAPAVAEPAKPARDHDHPSAAPK